VARFDNPGQKVDRAGPFGHLRFAGAPLATAGFSFDILVGIGSGNNEASAAG
jgi:hypothetical protein